MYIKVGECYSIDDDSTAIADAATIDVDVDDDFHSDHFRRMSITMAQMEEGHAKNIHDFAYWHPCFFPLVRAYARSVSVFLLLFKFDFQLNSIWTHETEHHIPLHRIAIIQFGF